jgi:hypothetical protein
VNHLSDSLTPNVRAIVASLGLLPHPEGGFYRETYRAGRVVPSPRGPRPACTAIYFLLPAGAVSRWHRIASDELWHFYAGDAIEIPCIDDSTGLAEVFRLDAGTPQLCVPAGRWFGARAAPVARLAPGAQDGSSHGYALCGCTVSPGFDFADFELSEIDAMGRRFPDLGEVISLLKISH